MKPIALLTIVSIGALSACAEKPENDSASPAAAPSFVRTAEQKSSDAVPVPPAMHGVPLNAKANAKPKAAEGEPNSFPTDEPPEPPTGETPKATENAEANPSAETEELPNITVKNIGMHIGGGPNTRAAKTPIREAVAKHYDELKACYKKAHKPRDKQTYGVDIRIPAKGGKAVISNPRTSLRGAGLRECMLSVFKRVRFPVPPQNQTKVVSFSVRFTHND